MLFLCLDNSPALKFLGDNWGPDAEKKVRESTYGCINILFDFDEPVKLDFEVIIELHGFIKVKKNIDTPIGTFSDLLLCVWAPIVSKELESWTIVEAEEKHSIINLGL